MFLERLRFWLFLATGLAVPFYAFPVARFAGKPVDLATLAAAAFVLASIPRFIGSGQRAARWLFAAAAAGIPLLVLRDRPLDFEIHQFTISYAHWLLVTLFFACALTLGTGSERARIFVAANWVLALLVALYALYQALGIPRGWPATGPVVLPGQRAPFRFTWIGGTYLGGGYTRPTSIFLEPAWVGGYLCAILVLAVCWLATTNPPRRRLSTILALPALAIPAAAILATVSWGAYVDFVAALVLLGVAFFRRLPRAGRRRWALLVPIALLLIFLLTPPGTAIRNAVRTRWGLLRETHTSTDAGSTARDSLWVRAENLRYTIRLIDRRPLTGVGLGQFGRSNAPDAPPPGSPVRDSWCGWLAAAAEMGVLGPAVLAFALLLVAFRSARGRPGSLAVAAPILAGLAFVQQLHTGSYIDLWWWFPVSAGAFLSSLPLREGPAHAPASGSA